MICIPYEDGVVELGNHHLVLEEDETSGDRKFFYTSNMQDFSYGNNKPQMQMYGESIQGDDLYKINNLVQLLSQEYVTDSGSAYAMAHDYHFDGDIQVAELDTTDVLAAEALHKGAFQPWMRSQTLPAKSGLRSQYMLKYILEASSRCNIAPLTSTDSQMSHKLAERKRRERQSYYMEKLKSLIPHNTKKDKISILESAINYIPKLQGQVKYLEQQNKMMEMAKYQRKRENIEGFSRDIEVSNIEGSSEVQITCVLSAQSDELVGLLLALKNMNLEVRSMLAEQHKEFLSVKLTASPLPTQMQVLSCAQVQDAIHNALS